MIKRILIVLSLFVLIAGGLYFVAEHRLAGKKLGGDFTLHSSEGDISLSVFRGKGVVLFFGYTSCPDVCPMSMSKLAKILRDLPEEQRTRIVPIFVSVDSRGDTPEKVQNYASFFLKGAKGVTGSKEEIDRVVDLYGTSYIFDEMPNSAMSYSVQHSSSFFLVNSKGEFVGKASGDSPPEDLKAAILALI